MSIANINKQIKLSASKYSLSQGVRISMTHLQKIYPSENPQELYERLRFKSNPSLSFAKSEISKIEFINTSKGKNAEITLNFLGLSGATSPLPSHYCEMVLDSVDTDEVLKDFLDLFNHHIQKMFYPIWQRQRYYIQYQSDLSDKFSKYMLSILGLYSETQVKNSRLNFQKILPYIGLISIKQKSAGTLTSILRHYLDHQELEIVQCIQMNEKIPSWQYGELGEKNCSLGSNLLIGESIKTKASKFQILLNNIEFDSLYKYSIHGKKIGELKELIDFALNEPLEYELCLEIDKNKTELFELSKHHLGVNCFCGVVKEDAKIILSS